MTPLQKAVQAVIEDHCDKSPYFDDAMAELRKALAADLAQAVELVECAAIKNILDEYGLQAIDFVANFQQALAQQVAVPATDAEKMDLVTNWFSEEWAVKSALGLLDDYEHHHGIKAKPAHTDWSAA